MKKTTTINKVTIIKDQEGDSVAYVGSATDKVIISHETNVKEIKLKDLYNKMIELEKRIEEIEALPIINLLKNGMNKEEIEKTNNSFGTTPNNHNTLTGITGGLHRTKGITGDGAGVHTPYMYKQKLNCTEKRLEEIENLPAIDLLKKNNSNDEE